MSHFYDFPSDKMDVFELNLDSSGSMEDDTQNVIKGLEMYKKSFEGFPEANSIVVAISKFANDFSAGYFRPVKEFTFNYRPNGGTALCYSIVKGAEHLQAYMEEVTKRTGCIPRGTYVVFSDGEPCGDRMTEEQAKEAIEKLNYAGITTVFVAFGKAIRSEFGAKLGFMATIDVTDRDTLVNFLGVELSKSCKEQSQSLKALGANFFSQAANKEQSKGYSHATTQALNDTGWMDDLDDI